VILAILSIPAVEDFSSTAFFLFFKGGRWAAPLAPNEVAAAVCGKEYYEVYK